MIEQWQSSRTFAHGFLVMPAACYLIWCHRFRLIPLVPTPSAWGVLALILAGGAWMAGYSAGLVWVQQAAVVAMLPGLVWALLGTRIVRTLAWPLGFLGFLLPFGTSLEPLLQDLTVGFILIGLKLSGVPYTNEGYFIGLSSGTWEVAPDCGGLRYLLPGLALGYAFVTLVYQRPGRRSLFLLGCAVMLMLANGIRAFGIILGDHLGIAEGADHRLFSYTIYGLVVLLLFYLGLKYEEPSPLDQLAGKDRRRIRFLPVWKTVGLAFGMLALLALAPVSVWLMEAWG
jgi:exosortase